MAEKMVERIKRIASQPEMIRNIAICAHIDHGKTTFSDNLLAGAGMMSENLAGSARVLDFHEDEASRGITIDSASVSMVHNFEGKEYLINLIDTPGHVDFGGDVTRAMRAVDGAIVLCCASEGIMPQTETVMRQALKERVRPVLFINKADRLIKELKLTPEKMQERFMNIITNVNKLIAKIAEKEYGEKWQASVQDGKVAFGSAYHNWALSIPFMQANKITFKEVIEAYESDDEEKIKALAKKAPLHEVVLDMVVDHIPNPTDAQAYRIPRLWHGDPESETGKSLVNCDPKGPLFYVPIKIVVDPQAGEIVYGRCFSGTVKKGTEIEMIRGNQKGRIQQVFIANGAKREITDDVPAGNIVVLGGVKTIVGETITTVKDADPFDEISHLFEPVISKAIKAKSPGDLSRLVEILRIVQKEDPSIKIEIDEQTGQNLMHGMGELHLEIIENRIRSEKHLDVVTSPPIVIFRESISKVSQEFEGKSPNKHNKFYFVVEPLEEGIVQAIKEGRLPDQRLKGKNQDIRAVLQESGYDTKFADSLKEIYNGNLFFDQTRGQVHMIEVIEMLLDTFRDVMNNGPLAREPCFGVKVLLKDMKLHEDTIHRGPAQVYPAVREGIRGAMLAGAAPVLFEPMQTLLVECPSDYMGEISKLVTSKRGQMLDVTQTGDNTTIKAKMPVMELIGWSSDLRSATSGRGVSSLVDQTYESLPRELQDKVVKQIIERKGLSEGQVGL